MAVDALLRCVTVTAITLVGLRGDTMIHQPIIIVGIPEVPARRPQQAFGKFGT